MAVSAVIVVVDGPEHDPAESLLAHVDGLVLHGCDVVIADPLLTFVSVGTDLVWKTEQKRGSAG